MNCVEPFSICSKNLISHTSTHIVKCHACLMGFHLSILPDEFYLLLFYYYYYYYFGCAEWHVGYQFPHHRLNSCPLQWKRRVLATDCRKFLRWILESSCHNAYSLLLSIFTEDYIKGIYYFGEELTSLLAFPSRDKVYISFIQASDMSICELLFFLSCKFSTFLTVCRW